MKHIITIGLIILIAITSCRKTRTCTCLNGEGNKIDATPYVVGTKKEQQKWCDTLQTFYQLSDSSITCILDYE